jgi:hypothetical protein
MAAVLVYFLATPGYGIVNAPVNAPLFFCVLCIVGCKGLVSVWFTGYLKTGHIFTKREENLFRTLYIFILFLSAAAALVLAGNLPQELKTAQYISTLDAALQAGLVGTTLCMVFMAITGHRLVKIIKQKHYDEHAVLKGEKD